MENKLNVAFICVHNSCRSQIAEAISKIKYSDVFNAFSAGSELSRDINQDAIRLIKDRYDYDMSIKQKPKLIEDLPKIDIQIKMGCNVKCPMLDNQILLDWNLEDPTNKGDEEFNLIIDKIEEKLKYLSDKIKEK